MSMDDMDPVREAAFREHELIPYLRRNCPVSKIDVIEAFPEERSSVFYGLGILVGQNFLKVDERDPKNPLYELVE